MTKNWEVFDRDPRGWTIPNQGVTKVGRPDDEGDWEVLRWELSSFVCEGEYAEGLERILNQYVGNLGNPEQAAVWVSGFYGSGKSHLVRVLASIWTDQKLPDGSTARGTAKVTQGIKDALKELSTAGGRGGGLWSAAGKLGSGVKESYRLAFLSVLFGSAGLPTQYPAARLAMMLKREGALESVMADIEKAGKDPKVEFLNLYASTVLGQAVVDALPDFAVDQLSARDIFRAQYPMVKDISDSETITVMSELLGLQSDTPDQVPCTVIVLDELQQYVGDDNEKLEHVQNITELCATNFGSRVMVVGTGQSALQGGGILAKIQHRFYLRVELSDKDVEQVTRTVALRKKPQMQQPLAQALEKVSGEINKHLASTKIGARPADHDDLVPDYPILPVRRRFWEQALRSIDRGGGTGQLRTQLRVTHDANQLVADADVGTVVGADFIFENQASGMLSAKVLSQEMYQRIKAYEDGGGSLKARVLGLIFLMAQLPRDEGADQGLRSRPDMLAELLVSDLASGSAALQPQVESALASLEHDGVVVNVDGEFRLQTREGQRLNELFQDRLGQIRNDTSRLSQERDGELRRAVDNAIGNLRVVQGASKTPRRAGISFGFDSPDTTGKDIPVWVRDEWSVSAAEFRSSAQQAGTSDPTVFVFLPRLHHDRIRDLLAGYHASTEVLQATPSPDTPEGFEAVAGLEARQRSTRSQLDQVVAEVLAAAKVWQAGGTEVSEGALPASVYKAVDSSLIRKFPKFKDADHAKWGTVLDRAKEGNQNPLDVVGHRGEVGDHPVCRAILSFLAAGKKGQDVRSHFGGGEYGWPDDAINGALLALLAAGLARATDKAGKPTSVKDIRQSDINATTFRPETVVVTAAEKIAVRKLLADFGVVVGAGEELEGVARFMQQLADLAGRAGGEPPLPTPPTAVVVNEMQALAGNGLIQRAHDERDNLKALHVQWTQLAASSGPRMAAWKMLQRLLGHALGLDVVGQYSAGVAAIESDRQVLANPDLVQPILDAVTTELRGRLQQAHAALLRATEEAVSQLRALPAWSVVGDSAAADVLGRHGLAVPPSLSIGSAHDVLAALDKTPLADWDNRKDAIPARVAAVQAELAQLAQPEATVKQVNLPGRVLKTPNEIDAYVEEIRSLLHGELTDNAHLSV